MRLRFVTSNPGKVEEARAYLEPAGVEVAQADVGYPEVQAADLATVARHGARHLAGEVDAPFLLDDAGLFVDALAGFPGVYSSYVYGTIGLEGILRLLEGREDRGARFEAVLAYHTAEVGTRLFEGVCRGRIARSMRKGRHGFGYDPIFVPEGRDVSFAEMPAEEKNEISHRGRALQALAEHLRGMPAEG